MCRHWLVRFEAGSRDEWVGLSELDFMFEFGDQ